MEVTLSMALNFRESFSRKQDNSRPSSEKERNELVLCWFFVQIFITEIVTSFHI